MRTAPIAASTNASSFSSISTRVSRSLTLLDAIMTRATGTAKSTTRQELSMGVRVAAVWFVTVLTTIAAQISVPLPFTPVPFTFQPMIVLLGGAALGARLGMSSQILYLLLGVAGLPVFAASPLLPQGAARLMGPTAGFLLSYPFAAYVTGWLAERGFGRGYLTSVAAMAAGLAIVFTCGALWMAYNPFAPTGLTRALQAAVVPFIPADLVKICLAAAVLPAAWRFLGTAPGSGLSR
jgi:biotin transport system substrate-specific component